MIRRSAKTLLAEAGLADGFSTELYANNTDPNPRIAQAIQQDLAAIGIKAELKSLAQANVIAAGGDGSAPMIWSGGMAWIADFPDPSNFYGPILGCGGAVQGGWNWSWYCNEELDKLAAEADCDHRSGARPRSARSSGARSTPKIMEDAPWAPVFNEQRFTMRSTRMGGDDALYVDPVHIPVALRRVSVNDVAVTRATPSTARHHHFGWDNSFPPVRGWRPARRSSSSASTRRRGQLSATSTRRRRRRRSISGGSTRSPARSIVEGAEPGDALKVTIGSSCRPASAGPANIPGFGLLADQFRSRRCRSGRYDAAGRRPRCSRRRRACR